MPMVRTGWLLSVEMWRWLGAFDRVYWDRFRGPIPIIFIWLYGEGIGIVVHNQKNYSQEYNGVGLGQVS